MNIITEAIMNYASGNGMFFSGGFKKGLTETKLEFPLIWMEPLVVTGKNGVNEGSISYKVKLHILYNDRNYLRKEIEGMWESIKMDAVSLYDSLAGNNMIASVKNLTCSPSELKLTNYGELSMTVTFDAEVLFRRD